MRKGLLLTLLLSWFGGGAALAQPHGYYPPPPYPGMGYGPPPVLVGGLLRADGPILLPNTNGKARTVGQIPAEIVYPAQPPRPAAPAPKSKAAPIQHTSKYGPAGEEGTPTDADPSTVAVHPVHHHHSAPLHMEAPLIGIGGPCDPHLGCGLETGPHADRTPAYRPPFTPRGHKYYGSLEYLFWWVNDQDAPPLLVVGPAGSPPVVVGGDTFDLDNRQRQGGRFTFGRWCNSCQTLGVEATYLFLGQRTPSLTASSTGNTLLMRPFIDALTGAPSGIQLAEPGISTATSQVQMLSRLWSVEGNLRKELWRFRRGHVDLLAGFRYLQLNEHLAVNDAVVFAADVPVFFSRIFTHDFFGTENSFAGGQIGLQSQWQLGRFYLDAWTKLALGNNHQTVLINGSTVTFLPPPAGDITLPGGILAQPSNIGRHERDRFAIVPELGVRVGIRLTDYIRVGAGYTVLYLNNAVRPGEQIDPVVNPTQIPQLFLPAAGAARPAFQFHESDFWVHGINFELEYRF